MKKAKILKLAFVFIALLFYVFSLASCSSNKDKIKATSINSPPFISQISPANATVAPSSELRLEVLAEDSNNDPLSFLWEIEQGSFKDAIDNKSVVTWIAPDEEGIYEITITVADDKEQNVSETVEIRVSAAAGGTGTPEFVMFQIVDAQEGRGENWSGNPNDNLGGQLHVKIATWVVIKAVAVDPDGDELTFSWVCFEGSFTTFTGKVDVKSTDYDPDHDSVVWTAPGNVEEDLPITVSIKDRYGEISSHTVNVTLFVDTTTDTRDGDGDSVRDLEDNCPDTPNPDQANEDGDDWGDACDFCPYEITLVNHDSDGDGFGDECDNCVYDSNPDQADSDEDGYGDICDEVCDADGDGHTKESCGGDDCDDNEPFTYLGHPETCDLKDNDCDGSIDEEGSEGCTTYYKDQDDDGYAGSIDSKCLCAPDGDYCKAIGDDCDDEDSAINPAAVEECEGGVDDDCDGFIDDADDDCTSDCIDLDGDGYGVGTECIGADCDDAKDYVNPTMTEIEYNGLDDDCDPLTLDDDLDQDGFLLETDCNDEDEEINPDADEICDDLVDNDCDELVDLDDENCVPENCVNSLDDDADGLIDLADPECAEFKASLESIKSYYVVHNKWAGDKRSIGDAIMVTDKLLSANPIFFPFTRLRNVTDDCESEFNPSAIPITDNWCIPVNSLFDGHGKVSPENYNEELEMLKVYFLNDFETDWAYDHAYIIGSDTDAEWILKQGGWEFDGLAGYIKPYDEGCPTGMIPLERFGNTTTIDYAVSANNDYKNFLTQELPWPYRYSSISTLFPGEGLSNYVGCVWLNE